MKKITLILVFLICQTPFFAQTDYLQKAAKPTANYFDIVGNTRAYFKSIQQKSSKEADELKDDAEEKFERWAYYWKDRVSADGKFPSALQGYYNAGILDAQGRIVTKAAKGQQTQTETWTNIGPAQNPVANGYPNPPQMGRLNAFLRIKHPTDRSKDVLFVGAPDGGLWKSTDNGATWVAKLDNVAGIGVTDIKTASTTTFANYTTSPIYVSTGDNDGSHVKSIGVLKSTDGGETFASTALTFPLSSQVEMGELVVLDDNTVLVGENQYIKKTTDGGANWTTAFDSNFGIISGKAAVSGTNIMYAGVFSVYFSSDSGATWSTPISSNTQDKNAVTFGSDGFFYIQNQAGDIKKFDTGTKTFSAFGTKPTDYDSQGGYNQAILFKDGLFLVSSVNGLSSADNGATWYRSMNGYYNPNGDASAQLGNYVHSDFHGMGPLDGTYEFWVVNDGGLSFVTYTTANDQKPTVDYKSNGVVVTQLYDVAITPNSAGGNYIMANQDNDGFSKEMHNGSMQWVSASAGDGVCSVINYNNPGIRYLGGTKGNLTKANAGFSGSYNGNTFGTVAGAAFSWPLEINTTDPTILYAGGGDLYKITDATANADLATSIGAAVNLASGAGQISKIATHGTGIAVVGATASKLTVNGGTSWTTITNPTGETINSVDFDEANKSILYCTVSGYTDGKKVFKSTDSGATWTNISAGLPNVVMKEVVFKQNQTQGTELLFVATELGVYMKVGAANWAKLGGQSMPNVVVTDIDINYTEDKLVAATFGRGLWEISIVNATLGVSESTLSPEEFKAYPNPVVDGNLNFSISKKYSNFTYKIYNILGGVVAEGKSEATQGKINVAKLASGIYMFKAYKKGVVFPTVKFYVKN